MDLNKGDTQLILETARTRGVTLDELAYILATAYWESASTMKPVREYGSEDYLKAKKYYPYVGMGYVQLTWKANYEKATKFWNERFRQPREPLVDFVKNPKDLLKAKYAVVILVVGMQEGWFTGKDLDDYIDSVEEDEKEDLREFYNARRIINGSDKQGPIADLAVKYRKDLKSIGYKPGKAPTVPTQPIPEVPAPVQPTKPVAPVEPQEEGFWASLINFILNAIKGK